MTPYGGPCREALQGGLAGGDFERPCGGPCRGALYGGLAGGISGGPCQTTLREGSAPSTVHYKHL